MANIDRQYLQAKRLDFSHSPRFIMYKSAHDQALDVCSLFLRFASQPRRFGIMPRRPSFRSETLHTAESAHTDPSPEKCVPPDAEQFRGRQDSPKLRNN
jgi:hypothetical protein